MKPPRMEQHLSHIGGARVYYEATGSGPAVVLLHGLSGSSRWWVKNTAALAQHFRIYAPDLPGFGRSRGQRFSLDDSSSLLAAWLEQLDEPVFHIVGHSMGGLVATQVAARIPRQVDRLVLVDSLALPVGRSIFASAARLLPAAIHMPLDFLLVLFGDALRAGPVNLLRATYAIHHADITATVQARQEAADAHTLIVWGDRDWLLPLSLGEGLHQLLPSAQFALFPGAGHVPMWEQPERFNQVVLQFLLGGEG